MKKVFSFLKQNRITILFIVIAICCVITVLMLPYFIIIYDPIWNYRFWYFAGVIIFFVLGIPFVIQINSDNPFRFVGIIFTVLVKSSLILLIISFILSLMYFAKDFLILPISIKAVVGWPALSFLYLFVFMYIVGNGSLIPNTEIKN
jgi:hypothetical protein